MATTVRETVNTELANEQYQRVASGKEQILEMLRKKGFRVTKQRCQILDVILEHECTSCKEVYYRAIQKNSRIGMATVYRMVNTLTDIGVLKMASLKPQTQKGPGSGCEITLRNQETVELTKEEWNDLLSRALQKKGVRGGSGIAKVVIKQ